MSDQGPNPYVVNIETATLQNEHFRDTLWTGKHLQLTVMRIAPGEDIGLEAHDETDQFLRIEQGNGRVLMGPDRDDLSMVHEVSDDDVILVPAGTWHNVQNTGTGDLKVYSLYAPPDHLAGTRHPTKSDAENDPNEQH